MSLPSDLEDVRSSQTFSHKFTHGLRICRLVRCPHAWDVAIFAVAVAFSSGRCDIRFASNHYGILQYAVKSLFYCRCLRWRIGCWWVWDANFLAPAEPFRASLDGKLNVFNTLRACAISPSERRMFCEPNVAPSRNLRRIVQNLASKGKIVSISVPSTTHQQAYSRPVH